MSRLIVLLLVITLVVGFQLQMQPILSILGDETCEVIQGECPITTGTTPVCHYSKTSDFLETTYRFCLYGSGQNGVSQDFNLVFQSNIVYLGIKANRNCKTHQQYYNILGFDCSCEGSCYIQADYLIKIKK